jgi:hypothetical protein
VKTIHHDKPKASKMGTSAKLEVPIPHGKNGCANLNEKMGTEKVESGGVESLLSAMRKSFL